MSFITGDEKSVSENSSLTRGQLLALVIAFFLRHKLTKVALRDLLQLLNLVLPDCVPATKHFLQPFLYWGNNVQEHFYCPKCAEYVNQTDSECTVCNTRIDVNELRQQSNFFSSSFVKGTVEKHA